MLYVHKSTTMREELECMLSASPIQLTDINR